MQLAQLDVLQCGGLALGMEVAAVVDAVREVGAVLLLLGGAVGVGFLLLAGGGRGIIGGFRLGLGGRVLVGGRVGVAGAFRLLFDLFLG